MRAALAEDQDAAAGIKDTQNMQTHLRRATLAISVSRPTLHAPRGLPVLARGRADCDKWARRNGQAPTRASTKHTRVEWRPRVSARQGVLAARGAARDETTRQSSRNTSCSCDEESLCLNICSHASARHMRQCALTSLSRACCKRCAHMSTRCALREYSSYAHAPTRTCLLTEGSLMLRPRRREDLATGALLAAATPLHLSLHEVVDVDVHHGPRRVHRGLGGPLVSIADLETCKRHQSMRVNACNCPYMGETTQKRGNEERGEACKASAWQLTASMGTATEGCATVCPNSCRNAV